MGSTIFISNGNLHLKENGWIHVAYLIVEPIVYLRRIKNSTKIVRKLKIVSYTLRNNSFNIQKRKNYFVSLKMNS